MSSLLEQIKQQVNEFVAEGQSNDSVDEIQVCDLKGFEFTNDVKHYIESFKNLKVLALNCCEIKDLKNFPLCKELVELELQDNKLKGESLVYLNELHNLQALYLGGNQIKSSESLIQLKGLKNLKQLDLLENPIEEEPNFREKLFKHFGDLEIIDNFDKEGNEINLEDDDDSEIDDDSENDEADENDEDSSDQDQDQEDYDDDDDEDEDDEEEQQQQSNQPIKKKH